MRIIGLAGKARSGKDTVAGFLSEAGFEKRAFADPLKAAAREIFSLTDSQLYGDQKERVDAFWGCTPREILQKLGTECLRKGYADDVWVRAMERFIQNGREGFAFSSVVISDVRFRNEADAIIKMGGEVWRIDRTGAGATGGIAGHVSEHDLDGWTGFATVIDNNGTLDDLRAKVVRIDAPRLLAKCAENITKGKYRCDFGRTTTAEGHRRTLDYVSKHGVMFSGRVGDAGLGKVIRLSNRPWLGRKAMFMSPVDCFVWQFVKPPMLVLCEDTMRMKEASEDPASSFVVDVGAAARPKYGAVVVGEKQIGPAQLDVFHTLLQPGGHLVYKGDHDGGNALIDWATANGWAVHGEEFGESLCGVVAMKPAAAKEATS